jgi:DNA adenine methylase
MLTADVKAPFPWFGGKRTVAPAVWRRFGGVRNYVEPFAGSLAVLLGRPVPFDGPETVNDVNGWLCNFWRALAADPDAVACHGDWLFYRAGAAEWCERLRADPDFFDAKSAGWWVWGQCCWIGTGWGPRQLPHLGDAGRGEPQAALTDTPKGEALRDYLRQLSRRLRGVRVCCGDWSRVCGPSVTTKQGLTAVFLDPPYGVDDRADTYDADDRAVAARVRRQCLAWGRDPLFRIALCGYDGEHAELEAAGWSVLEWKARGGYGSQSAEGNDNCRRERVWFSPHCLNPEREPWLFDATPPLTDAEGA